MIKKFEITNNTLLSTFALGKSEPVSVDFNQFVDLLDKHWQHIYKNYLYWEFYIDHEEGTIMFSCIVTKWVFFTKCERKLKYKLINPNEIIVYKDINSNIIQENVVQC